METDKPLKPRGARIRLNRKKVSEKGRKRYRRGSKQQPPPPKMVFFIPRYPSEMPEQAKGQRIRAPYYGANLKDLRVWFERVYGYGVTLSDEDLYECLRDFHTEPPMFHTAIQRRERCLDYVKRWEFDLLITRAGNAIS